jgi:arginyl-tRNA synthetase
MGWDVTRMNYLGDWGKHVGLLEAGWSRFGSEEKLASDPLRHLLDVFTQIDELLKKEAESRPKARDDASEPAEDLEVAQAQFDAQGLHNERDIGFKKLEDGDGKSVQLWQKFRDVSIAQYTKLYARLGVVFDEYSGESQVSSRSLAKVEEELRKAGVYEEDHGAWKVDLKKHGVKGASKGILRFRNGTTTYLLRDIAAVLDRDEKYGFDKMIYVVEGQESHFQSVFKALELMGRKDLVDKLQHVHFAKGPEFFPEAETKINGNSDHRHVQLLEEFMDLARNAAAALVAGDTAKASVFPDASDAVSDRLGASSLIVQALHTRPKAAVTFDLVRATTFEGDTGSALQYWQARLSSLLRDASGPANPDYGAVDTDEYSDLLRLLAQWPDAVKAAARSPEFIGVLPFLFRLLGEVVAILGDEEETSSLTGGDAIVMSAARQVLENGMRAMGLTPLVEE